MNYTLNQLRIFQKIAQTESITKASEELHLTQPAVSIQLRNLQDQFEIPLTEVIGRKLYITDFGREIAAATDTILNEVHSIKHKAMAYKGHLTGDIKISAASTAKYVMPYFITDFLKTHDNIDLMMDVTNKMKVIRSLENNEIDFAMVSVLPEKLEVDRIELLQNKLFLIGNTQIRKDNKSIDNQEIENLPLIFREEGSATRKAMEDFMKRNKIKAKKKMILTSNEAVKQAVVAGLGYSIMPLIGLKNEINNGQLQVIPTKQLPIITEWNLIWLKNKNFSPAAKAYLEYLEQHKESVIKKHFAWCDDY